MRLLLCSLIFSSSFFAHADTIDHYMNISNNIPQMEMKADPQSQAWARSARNVLAVTTESIAETLTQANDLAKTQGRPLFCLPVGGSLNAATLNGIIVQTYQSISSQQSDKDKMTVSQIAWLGVAKTYPCQPQPYQGGQMQLGQNSQPGQNPPPPTMQHMGTLLGQQ